MWPLLKTENSCRSDRYWRSAGADLTVSNNSELVSWFDSFWKRRAGTDLTVSKAESWYWSDSFWGFWAGAFLTVFEDGELVLTWQFWRLWAGAYLTVFKEGEQVLIWQFLKTLSWCLFDSFWRRELVGSDLTESEDSELVLIWQFLKRESAMATSFWRGTDKLKWTGAYLGKFSHFSSWAGSRQQTIACDKKPITNGRTSLSTLDWKMY